MGKKKNPWRTKVGKDCVDLRSTLSEWLAKRLLFLAEHSNGIPMSYCLKYPLDAANYVYDDAKAMAEWKKELSTHATALFRFAKGDDTEWGRNAAQHALRWTAEHITDLWD